MAARKKKSAAKSTKSPKKSAKKSAKKSTEKSSETAAKPSGGTSGSEVTPRAHPDAGLTKPQVKKLYQKLIEEHDRIATRIRQRVGHATEDASPLAEEGDIAQRATEQDYQLRMADKQRKLLDQVLVAIDKIENGEYGVCEGSEEPIGYRRLEIRPWARYSVEYKEQMDRRNR